MEVWDEGEEHLIHPAGKDEDLASLLIGYRTVLPAEIGFEVRYE